MIAPVIIIIPLVIPTIDVTSTWSRRKDPANHSTSGKNEMCIIDEIAATSMITPATSNNSDEKRYSNLFDNGIL
jgi:hypothetical protein